jgi:hypothetical protein
MHRSSGAVTRAAPAGQARPEQSGVQPPHSKFAKPGRLAYQEVNFDGEEVP